MRLKATVQPGNRVEFTAPELPEGAEVDIVVTLPEAPRADAGVADYLASLPPVERTPEEWAAIERDLQEERNAWDR